MIMTIFRLRLLVGVLVAVGMCRSVFVHMVVDMVLAHRTAPFTGLWDR